MRRSLHCATHDETVTHSTTLRGFGRDDDVILRVFYFAGQGWEAGFSGDSLLDWHFINETSTDLLHNGAVE